MPKITFLPMNQSVEVVSGTTILEAAHQGDISLEGACEGSMACSTCHVVVSSEWYDTLPFPSEEEEDMLDRAFGLTPTSRLGCQVAITDELDGLIVTIPEYSVNMRVDK